MTRDNKFYNDPLNSEDKKSERILRLEGQVNNLKRKSVRKKERYKPINTIDYLGSGAGGSTPPSEVPSHPISGVGSPHTGAITDGQAPQFLKTDGSRGLTGSLSVATGMTIDGVDLDVLEMLFENHLNPTSDDHPQYATSEYAEATRPAKEAYKLLRTITARDGLSGGGILTADLSLEVNKAHNFTWTGDHSFTKTMYAGSIMPHNSDTYDLGSMQSLWRKIFASELSAVVFAQYEQVLLGGWFTVSKGEGVLPADVISTDTVIDLGARTFDAGDILVFRGVENYLPIMEYVRVVSLASGTTYNVTRGFGGTGANDWQTGTVFANYGTAGDGRIELNAYDSPRISVFSHASTIAGFREQVRIGDLLNGWGYSASTYGAVFGAYEPGKANITIDPTNGIRLRNYNKNAVQLDGTKLIIGELAVGKPNVLIDSNGLYIRNYTTEIIKLTGKKASFENVLELGTNGRLQQGTGTWGTDFTGTALWNDSGVMNVGGWNDNVKQWWGGSDGTLYAGDGDVILNENGITIHSVIGDEFVNPDSLKFQDIGGTEFVMAKIWAYKDYGLAQTNHLLLETETDNATSGTSITLYAHKTVGGSADDAEVTVSSKAGSIPSWIKLLANDILLNGNVEVNGTIKDGDGVAYLKSTGKAADSDKLDGLDSTAFLQVPTFSTTAPTPTASSGTFTTVSCVMKAITIGKLRIISGLVYIGNAGTASGTLRVPYPSGAPASIGGGRWAGAGYSAANVNCIVSLLPSNDYLEILKYDGTTAIGTGASISFSISYELS